jgi:hypothetical protein
MRVRRDSISRIAFSARLRRSTCSLRASLRSPFTVSRRLRVDRTRASRPQPRDELLALVLHPPDRRAHVLE